MMIIPAALLLAAAIAVLGVYLHSGARGITVLMRLDWTAWANVRPDDPRLSASMRLALTVPPAPARAGPFEWQQIDQGFDVAELPVLAAGTEVDRILLARVDPARFRLVVRSAPSGDRRLGDWMRELEAALVINGSYFLKNGTPETPVVSAGARLGPGRYDATHGAFVSSARFVGIHDLANADWRALLHGADDAVVSYPLLVSPDGSTRVKANPQWLANRSFIAADASGRIVLGTTTDAFFSLGRLAAFLREAPLELTIALNLDGGPVACQGIALNRFRREFCGQWELATKDGQLRLLTRALGARRTGLPIALAVLRK